MKVNIFNFQLVAPVILVVLGVYEIFDALKPWTNQEQIYLRFLSNIIFINALHVGMMFVYMAMLPSFRNWHNERNKTGKVNQYLAWIIFFFLMILLQVLQKMDLLYFDKIIKIGLVGFAAYHTLRQSFGISLLINRSRYNSQKLKNKAHESYERALVYILLLGLLTPLAFESFSINTFTQTQISLISASFMSIAVVILVALNLVQMSEGRYLKAIYAFRYFIYPLSFFSFLGAVGIGMIHGIEYFLVLKQLIRKTPANKVLIDRVTFSSIGILVTVFVLNISNQDHGILQIFIPKQENLFLFYEWGAIVLGAISFLHYYVEGKLFQFSNQTSRKHILPLFKNF